MNPLPDWPRLLAGLAVILASIVNAGCGESETADSEREHASHERPPHKPLTYPEAVQDLRTYHEAIATAANDQEIDQLRDDLLPIQYDLARWLPELAADSDLPEAPWNVVHEASKTLVPIYERLIDVAARQQAIDYSSLTSTVERELARLDRIVAESDPEWFALPIRPRSNASNDEIEEEPNDE